jgi:hypothetical protein
MPENYRNARESSRCRPRRIRLEFPSRASVSNGQPQMRESDRKEYYYARNIYYDVRLRLKRKNFIAILYVFAINCLDEDE